MSGASIYYGTVLQTAFATHRGKLIFGFTNLQLQNVAVVVDALYLSVSIVIPSHLRFNRRIAPSKTKPQHRLKT